MDEFSVTDLPQIDTGGQISIKPSNAIRLASTPQAAREKAGKAVSNKLAIASQQGPLQPR
jgi:hypothetical protein